MKVLQLYANYKWTGPADLALLQTQALQQAGCDVEFALASWTHPGQPHAIRSRAEGLGLRCTEGLRLRRHYHLPTILHDAQRLSRWIEDRGYSLLHCHQPGDHFVAALARSWCSRSVGIVRSFWEQRLPSRMGRMLFAFQRTEALVGPFAGSTRALGARFDLPADRVHVMPPILDRGFVPPSPGERAQARAALAAEFGIGGGDFCVGLTARIQKRRRWELAWDTAEALVRRVPEARLCVLGRPDEGVFDELCARPVAERGLEGRVVFLGYRAGPAYRAALAACDAFLFLVPGSDATCRALREAMAMARPAVVTDMAPLPELVGTSAAVRPAQPEALAAALAELAEDPQLRARRGDAARAHAVHGANPSEQAEALLALYRAVRPGAGA